jgi:predicted DNA-binding protein
MKYKGDSVMPLSLRIPPQKEKKIRKAAARSGKTKTSYVLEAIDEKLGLQKPRAVVIRETAGWMSHEEAEELRKAISIFDKIHEGDWD